jgi:hypothetical protein
MHTEEKTSVLTLCRGDYLPYEGDDPCKLVFLKKEKRDERVDVGPRGMEEDTHDSEYGGEEEEVVGEDWCKVETIVAASWRHDWTS